MSEDKATSIEKLQALADALVEQSFKDNREAFSEAYEKLFLGQDLAIKVSWDEDTNKVKMNVVHE